MMSETACWRMDPGSSMLRPSIKASSFTWVSHFDVKITVDITLKINWAENWRPIMFVNSLQNQIKWFLANTWNEILTDGSAICCWGDRGQSWYPWSQQHHSTDCQQEQVVTSTQSAYNSCESVAAVYNPPTPPYIFLIGKSKPYWC